MPRGVTDQFLRILRAQRRTDVRTAVAMAGLAVLAYFMAELTDRPRFGQVVLLTLLCIALGAAGGLAWGRHKTKRYNDSLRDAWNAWMRMSLSCTSVDEVAAHVHEKRRIPALAGAGWGALLVANALLFVFLWTETTFAYALGIGVAATNGLVLGFVAGEAIWSARWTAQFAKALDEMLAAGQIGIWGEV